MHLHLVKAFDDAAHPIGATAAGDVGHDVQFYKSDAYLTSAVSDFLAAGVRVGQPLIVIATQSHRIAFARELRARGLDIDEILSGREATWLDARETLAAFMEGGHPNAELFHATVGSVFGAVLRKRHYLVVRGYGEMVDLLAQDGNLEGAILLESLWNDLATKYAYSLLCGYSLDNFLHEAGPQNLKRVCAQHNHSLPPEGYIEATA
ncbi:MAG: MEDS domain-containing protein [Gemmatimonadaceae bacterium]